MLEFNEMMWHLALAFVLGAVVGLEREGHRTDEDASPKTAASAIVGVRSFALLSGLGGVAGLLWPAHGLMVGFISALVGLLLLAYYVLHSLQTQDTGITTEFAAGFVYVMGYLATTALIPAQAVVAMTVVVVLLLSRKREIKRLSWGLEQREFNAFVFYGLIALVILPFLPNQGYTLQDVPSLLEVFRNIGWDMGSLTTVELINPFRLWLIVALITGLDLAGHVLERSIGRGRGRFLTSAVGGFISSTATTQALAQESKQSASVNHLVVAAIVANLTSFLQMFLLLASVNAVFAAQALPVLIGMTLAGVGMAWWYQLRGQNPDQATDPMAEVHQEGPILALKPALKFAWLYILVRFVSQAALVLLGGTGFLIATGLAGFSGTDAATINTAVLVQEGSIGVTMGLFAFVLVNAVNLGAKTFYSHLQGSRAFTLKLGIAMLAIVLGALVGVAV